MENGFCHNKAIAKVTSSTWPRNKYFNSLLPTWGKANPAATQVSIDEILDKIARLEVYFDVRKLVFLSR